MKEEDVKYMGQEVGQVLGNQFNSSEGSSSLQALGVHMGCGRLQSGGVTWHQRSLRDP